MIWDPQGMIDTPMDRFDLLIAAALIFGGLVVAAIAGLIRRDEPDLGNVGRRGDWDGFR